VDNELDLLLGTAIDSLLKLDVLLYLQSRPGSVQSSQDIAAQVRRPPYQVSASLDELSQAGLVDRFALGTGRRRMSMSRRSSISCTNDIAIPRPALGSSAGPRSVRLRRTPERFGSLQVRLGRAIPRHGRRASPFASQCDGPVNE